MAKEIINASDDIVVIGYTFPLYNRLVDLEYFNGDLLKSKVLYIQDPNASGIENGIKPDFSIRKGPTNVGGIDIKIITDCDSFKVPSNTFTYIDSLAKLFD